MWFTMNMGGCLGVVHCEKGVYVWVWFTMNMGGGGVWVRFTVRKGCVFGCGSL